MRIKEIISLIVFLVIMALIVLSVASVIFNTDPCTKYMPKANDILDCQATREAK